ncbi:MAG: hypothetical protein ACRC33_07820, partial [Gemmataceae bacterium]
MRALATGLLIAGGLLLFSGFALFSKWGYGFASAGVILVAVMAFNYAWDRWYSLRPHLERHLGADWEKGEILRRPVAAGDRAPVQAALDRLQA